MDKPKRWVKNVFKKNITQWLGLSWVKTTQQILECTFYFICNLFP